jgi:benzil reductase ((S)-benzoin forming)
MDKVFISGVSTGIGFCLAKQLLSEGNLVFGVSRRVPAELIDHPNFRFCSADFSDSTAATSALQAFIANGKLAHVSKLFLNVGQFGKRIAPVEKIALVDLEDMMRVNVWSHKVLIDCLLGQNVAIDCAIFSSSIAGVRARAGNSGYAITKAALNMMAKLYALENPDMRVLVLGLCNVDTFLSRTIGSLTLEGDFAEVVRLRERAAQASHYLTTPERRAADILALFEPKRFATIPNGDFVEIRDLLAAAPSPAQH